MKTYFLGAAGAFCIEADWLPASLCLLAFIGFATGEIVSEFRQARQGAPR